MLQPSQVAVPARRGEAVVPVADRRAVGVVAPGATTADTAVARRRAGVRSRVAYAAVPVPAPFKHVSAHVVYAK